MDLDTSLIASRDIFLGAFQSALRTNDPCHVEPALRDANGELVLAGPLQVPYRPDLIVKTSGESVMVDSPTRAEFGNIKTVRLGVPIEIAPFVWDYTKFKLFRPQNQEWQPLHSSFLKWFDVEDTNEQSDDGFFGVVHYLSDPSMENEEIQVVVDFGSAPIEAFHDVIQALCKLQPAKISIG